MCFLETFFDNFSVFDGLRDVDLRNIEVESKQAGNWITKRQKKAEKSFSRGWKNYLLALEKIEKVRLKLDEETANIRRHT